MKSDATPTIFVRAGSRPLTPALGKDKGNYVKCLQQPQSYPKSHRKKEELLRKGKDLEYVNN